MANPVVVSGSIPAKACTIASEMISTHKLIPALSSTGVLREQTFQGLVWSIYMFMNVRKSIQLNTKNRKRYYRTSAYYLDTDLLLQYEDDNEYYKIETKQNPGFSKHLNKTFKIIENINIVSDLQQVHVLQTEWWYNNLANLEKSNEPPVRSSVRNNNVLRSLLKRKKKPLLSKKRIFNTHQNQSYVDKIVLENSKLKLTLYI
jgi:hypothetical protein